MDLNNTQERSKKLWTKTISVQFLYKNKKPPENQRHSTYE